VSDQAGQRAQVPGQHLRKTNAPSEAAITPQFRDGGKPHAGTGVIGVRPLKFMP
jgi:hypothetical protein